MLAVTDDIPIALLQRVRGEFTEMPGLYLTPVQPARLLGLDAALSENLQALVRADFLNTPPTARLREGIRSCDDPVFHDGHHHVSLSLDSLPGRFVGARLTCSTPRRRARRSGGCQADRRLRVVDTNLASPSDFCEPGDEVPVRSRTYVVGPRSVVEFIRRRDDSGRPPAHDIVLRTAGRASISRSGTRVSSSIRQTACGPCPLWPPRLGASPVARLRSRSIA